MFGYVLVNRDDLTPEQYDRYHACYCGLCRELGLRYGLSGRMTLTYDMTFLALLLNSLYEPQEISGLTRCAPHPTKSHPYWAGEYTGYAADLNVLLAYYNCLDDWNDEHRLTGFAESRLLSRNCAALREKYPRQTRAIEYCLGELAKIEKSGTADPDAAAGCFGTLLGELFVRQEDMWSIPLRKMGSALGRYVYLLDALDDYEKDKKSGSYNPLAALDTPDSPPLTERCRSILTLLMSECAAEFEKLPVVTDAGLLRNILYSGVWAKYNQIEAKALKKRPETAGEGAAPDAAEEHK